MSDLGRLLIADDEETFLCSTVDLLCEQGYTCDGASDGATAVEKLRSGEYDLLIADIKMPGNPELELVQEVSTLAEGMPVILVTGYPSITTAIQSLGLPVMAYLVKPIDFEELLRHVRSGLDRSRTYRTIHQTKDRLSRWYTELEEMADRVKKVTHEPAPVPIEAFLVLTFQNIVDALSDLKNLTVALVGREEGNSACHLLDCPRVGKLLDALNETIDVLESSKSSFKSKELGKLREKLEDIINHQA